MKNNPTSRSLWPISITVFFVLAVIFLGTFVVWAVHQREDLVAVNYYDQEVRFQQHLDSVNRSQVPGLQARVTYDATSHQLVISVPAKYAANATGNIHLYRPSDARLDRDVRLAPGADGTQQIDTKKLPPGLWKARLKWSALGQEFFVEETVTLVAGN